ncbi:hypothetical protein E4U27_002054 [Claviceps purpurea]|nr:hypothetical protein E4U27_002054 [Claviceps purpurea]
MDVGGRRFRGATRRYAIDNEGILYMLKAQQIQSVFERHDHNRSWRTLRRVSVNHAIIARGALTTDFHNPAPCQAEEMEESAAQITYEKSMHELLMKHPHPNIVRCILCVPEGFFMERMEANLQTRLDQGTLDHATRKRPVMD